MTRRLALSALALAALSACSFRNVACGLPPPEPVQEVAPPAVEQPIDSRGTSAIGVSFLGDSLTAGYGLLSQQSYPSLIEEMFEAEGYTVDIRNGGVSGDTTAGGLRRLDQVIGPETRVLVVALGGNDALRGLTTTQTYDNLRAILDAAGAANVDVLLAGMEAPPNLGPDYQAAFRGVFQRLATEPGRSLRFVPFLLEGVAGIPALNQADGIHPNVDGARAIATLLYPHVRAMVDRAGGGGG